MNVYSPPSPSRWTPLLAGLGLALALAITLPPLSSTRLQTWPLAAAATTFWLLPVVIAAARLALGTEDSRLGGLLDCAFATLALAGLAATAASPLRATLAPALLPFFGALALPYALRPVLRSPRADLLAAAFIYPILFTCAFLWLSDPGARNAQPFGHANTTGAVCALSACWLAGIAERASTRAASLLHAGGVVLALGLAASSASRGAVIALALAAIVVAALRLLRRGFFLRFAIIAVLALAGAILTNHRLLEFARTGSWSPVASESNDQRMAMIEGGIALAAQRPLLGWGPGAVPHVFPSVRATLPGTPDNYLQLHNTLAQTAATLGGFGLAGVVLLLLAVGRRVRSLVFDPAHTTLVATCVCAVTVLLFDHSFATPAFALLAALPIAALREAGPVPADRRLRRVWWLALGALVAALALPVGRDLAARAAWATALDHAAADEPAAYVSSLREARALAPADPFYADQLASHLATGGPFPGLEAPAPAEAIPLLRDVLACNPSHESARYNLGWLLLSSAPGEAAAHFTAAARLAPSRAEVWLGLALARIRSGSAESPVPVLAAEVLLDPAFAWSPRWRDPALARYREAALAHAADFLAARKTAPQFSARLRDPGAPIEYLSAYRRVRTGHGVLYGHPDGPPPADINVLVNLAIPPALAAELPPKGFVAPALLLDCAGLAP